VGLLGIAVVFVSSAQAQAQARARARGEGERVSNAETTASEVSTRRSVPLWLSVPAAVGVGALISVQSRVSAALAQRSDVYNAAWVTVITGATILAAIIAFSPKARHGFRSVAAGVRSRSLPWWALLGGTCGMFFVVTQGTAAGVLGLAMFGMSVVAGQVVGGLVFDWIGLTGEAKRRPTILRVLGSLLAIGAVSWGAIAGQGSHVDVWLILMAFASGVGLAFSSGITGRVQATSNSAVTSGMVNHLVGLVVIVILLLILTLATPRPVWGFGLPGQPWLYLGGVIGPIGVAMGAILVRTLGVLLLGLGMVAGQLIGALVLELIVPTGAGVQEASVVGIALTLVAVALTSLDGRVKGAGARTMRADEPVKDPVGGRREAGRPSGRTAAPDVDAA
jgi:transporter family-2 protein